MHVVSIDCKNEEHKYDINTRDHLIFMYMYDVCLKSDLMRDCK